AAADAALAQFDGKLGSSAWTQIQAAIDAHTHSATEHNALARCNPTGDVQLDFHLTDKTKSTLNTLKAMGLTISEEDDSTIEAWVPSALLPKISSLAAVSSISLPDYARVRAGSATS